MKKPYKPYQPTKPTEPSTKRQIAHRLHLIDMIPNGSISFTEFLSRVPKDIPHDNMTLGTEENYDCYSGLGDTTFFIEYYEEVDNANYPYEMERYKKSIKNYEKKMEEYKPKLELYKKDIVVYDEWFKTDFEERNKRNKERELVRLKKRIAQLEKQAKKKQ